MRRDYKNDQLSDLLAARGDSSDAARYVRGRVQAARWALDIREGLITCLANDSYIPKEGFKIMDRVRGPEMDTLEVLHLAAFGELLGIRVEALKTAVTVLPWKAGERQHYSAFLNLAKLKELCQH